MFKNVLQLIFGILTLYIFFYILFSLYRTQLPDTLDSKRLKESVCSPRGRTVENVIQNINYLNSRRKKVIILGASNSRDGFRPKELKEYFPDYEIHNLAVSAGNITQVIEMVNFMKSSLPSEALENNFFVLGISSGVLTTNEERLWQHGSPFSNALAKIPNFRVPFLNRFYLQASLPIFCLRAMISNFEFTFNKWAKKPPKVTNIFRHRSKKVRVLDADKKAKIINRIDTMYAQSETPFLGQLLDINKLNSIINQIKSRLIIVDLPAPNWFKNASQADREYIRVINNSEFALALKVNSMRKDIYEDFAFKDHAHPIPSVTGVWAEQLNKIMRDKNFE